MPVLVADDKAEGPVEGDVVPDKPAPLLEPPPSVVVTTELEADEETSPDDGGSEEVDERAGLDSLGREDDEDTGTELGRVKFDEGVPVDGFTCSLC